MKKAISTLLTIVMCLSLAACAPAQDKGPDPSQPSTSDTSVYTTQIKGNDVKMTLNADQTEVTIEVMGMEIVAACEVASGKLALQGKISGNDQIWAGIAGNTYTLNSDGTAVADGEDGSEDDAQTGGDEILDEYTTQIKGNDVVMKLNADRTEVTIEVMGMEIVAACEIDGTTLTMKGKISGNDQIWAGIAANTYTLNSDGTAVANDS